MKNLYKQVIIETVDEQVFKVSIKDEQCILLAYKEADGGDDFYPPLYLDEKTMNALIRELQSMMEYVKEK